jgi:hypothetical protein
VSLFIYPVALYWQRQRVQSARKKSNGCDTVVVVANVQRCHLLALFSSALDCSHCSKPSTFAKTCCALSFLSRLGQTKTSLSYSTLFIHSFMPYHVKKGLKGWTSKSSALQAKRKMVLSHSADEFSVSFLSWHSLLSTKRVAMTNFETIDTTESNGQC